ncbi:FecR family protein [Marinomonas gallaica]|uniref:FecR family protein n=1 Tax=Marinomonas gallaica TaxID=1806667 RepID=UPI003CE457BB
MNFLRSIKFYANLGLTCFALIVTQAFGSPTEGAGEVTFALGKAYLNGKDLIKTGQHISEGDVIETLGNGHVHIRFVDNGLVSVRPDSRLSIEHYSYDAEHPNESIIKFNLNEGVMRSISGTGAKAARDKFRLNTPIAAIGVRGTDFVVKASNDLVQAIVNEGAIVVAPFSTDCNASSTGPCSGSIELSSTAKQLLELSSLYDAPRLIPLSAAFAPNLIDQSTQVETSDNVEKSNKYSDDTADQNEQDENNTEPSEAPTESSSEADDISSKETINKSAEDENTISKDSDIGSSDSSDSTDNQTSEDSAGPQTNSQSLPSDKTSSSDKVKRENRYNDLFSNDMSDDEVRSIIADITAENSFNESNPTSKLAWGRFGGFTNGVAENDVIIDSYFTIIESGPYDAATVVRKDMNGLPLFTILLRADSDDRAILDRSLGRVDFDLKDSQANLYLKNGGTESMTVSNDFLSIDFTKGSFETGLTLDSQSASTVDFKANGKISGEGELQLDDTSPFSGKFGGATTLEGDEAGYIFYKDVNAGKIEGATIWHKQ